MIEQEGLVGLENPNSEKDLSLPSSMRDQSEEPRSTEELEEAGLAVRLAGSLLKRALGERAQAEGAGEVVRVETAAQC